MHHYIPTAILKALLLASFFVAVQPAATYFNEKINPKVAQRISRLGNSFRDLPANALVIVDGDNVRGKTKFSASKEQLCKDLDILATSTGIDDRVVLMYDHGNEHEAFIFGSLAVCFSGPGRTADDVIARDLVWFQKKFGCPIVVVTADTGLKTRCFQGGRITGQQVTIIDSTAFVELLGSTIANISAENGTLSSPYSDLSNQGVPMNEEKPQAILSVEAMRPFTSERMNVLRRELGVRNQIRSIEKFVKGGCGKKKMVKLQKRAAELDARLKKVISEESVSLGATMEDAMKMSPEFQEAGYNALISMLRAGSTRGREETWERVLLAERFRNTLLATTLANTYQLQMNGDGSERAVDDVIPDITAAIETISIDDLVEDESESASEKDVSIDGLERIFEAKQILSIEKPLEIYCEEINKNYSRTNSTFELIRWIKSKENITVTYAVPFQSDVSADNSQISIENSIGITLSSTQNLESKIDLDESLATINNNDKIDSIFLIKVIDSSIYKGFKEDMSEPLEGEEENKINARSDGSGIGLKLSPIHEQILIQQKRIQYEAELEVARRENLTEEERSALVRTSRALTIMQKSLQGSRTSHNVPFQVNLEGSRIYELENLSRSPKGSSKKDKISTRKDLIGSRTGTRTGTGVGTGVSVVDQEISVVNITENSVSTIDTISGGVSTSLRIVCVSDTHGMENILTGSVPDGDIFIHSGDFAADKGKSRLKIKQLDEWLSKLPHTLKIVVRGNHDPLGGHFPISKAIYAERSSSILFKGITIGLAPHGTINVPNGDIIISHEPPYGVLDQALGRKKPHVGSHSLVKSVMKNTEKPQLWIFGHIHEGFGAIRTTFGSKGLTTHKIGQPIFSSTLCVNAASANPGPAHSIDNLPIIIDIKMVSNVIDDVDDENEMIDDKGIL